MKKGIAEVGFARKPGQVGRTSGILPLLVPRVTQIAALGGDEVCRSEEQVNNISINGKVVAEVLDQDREGRPLPSWGGSIHLVDDEIFLLQPHPYSFD